MSHHGTVAKTGAKKTTAYKQACALVNVRLVTRHKKVETQ
jgi:hypothetical protein